MVVADRVMVQGVETHTGPTILQRTDRKFVGAILDDLQQVGGVDQVTQSRAVAYDTTQNVLKLFQPVHRTFHVALLEAACDTFGSPRLDPKRIISAGLVVRRRGAVVEGVQTFEGWCSAGKKIQGWVQLIDPDLDPDPAQRPLQLEAGHPEIDRRLALLSGPGPAPLSESTSPLFTAPPAVGEATGRTILYGLVPVTSTETSEVRTISTMTLDDVQTHLASYFHAASRSKPIPYAGWTVLPNAGDQPPPDPSAPNLQYLQDYLGFLRQLLLELDAFGDSPASQTLFAALNAITVTHVDGTTGGAGDTLKAQADTLVKQKPGVAVTMPREWPPVTDAQAQALYAAAKTILDARTALVQPSEKRFIDQTSQYCVRAFVRVRSEHADCPPQTWWSDCSDPFVIAPWYDSSGVPPVQIVLPDATNMDLLKSLKPNVAFQVPKNLFNMLQNTKLKDLTQGTPPSSGGMTIDWICGFNIPIITLCAFIVLNIFLQLLDIVFFWMFIVKICIPIPRKK